MTEQAMREAFESVVLDEFTNPVLHRDSNGYVSLTVAFGYKCWQAALQWAAEGQEPVAWMSSRNGFIGKQRTNGDYDVPLYAAPVPNDLLAEMAEQCRIIGISAERELSLLAEVERLRKALDLLHRMNKAIDGLELSDLTDDDGIWRYFTADGPEYLDALQAEYAALAKGD